MNSFKFLRSVFVVITIALFACDSNAEQHVEKSDGRSKVATHVVTISNENQVVNIPEVELDPDYYESLQFDGKKSIYMFDRFMTNHVVKDVDGETVDVYARCTIGAKQDDLANARLRIRSLIENQLAKGLEPQRMPGSTYSVLTSDLDTSVGGVLYRADGDFSTSATCFAESSGLTGCRVNDVQLGWFCRYRYETKFVNSIDRLLTQLRSATAAYYELTGNRKK